MLLPVDALRIFEVEFHTTVDTLVPFAPSPTCRHMQSYWFKADSHLLVPCQFRISAPGMCEWFYYTPTGLILSCFYNRRRDAIPPLDFETP